jgi:uncharacterized protein (DUF2141 family)
MTKAILIALLLSFIEIPILFSQTDSKATLEITFTGLRNTKGNIAIGINHSPEGWPREPHLAPNWKKTNMVPGGLTVKIEDLDYGNYAISVLDDENSNFEMDNNFLGMPQEGYGFSRNPKVALSAPKFEECVFPVDKPYQKITIEVRYMGKGK